MTALCVAPDTTLTELTLPGADALSVVRQRVGTSGAVDQAVFHHRALLHVYGEGQVIGLGHNLAAGALASAWRCMTLYPLHGPVVITPDGEAAALDDDLAEHARTVAQTVREPLQAWKIRPGASSEAAVSELLACVAWDVASGR